MGVGVDATTIGGGSSGGGSGGIAVGSVGGVARLGRGPWLKAADMGAAAAAAAALAGPWLLLGGRAVAPVPVSRVRRHRPPRHCNYVGVLEGRPAIVEK